MTQAPDDLLPGNATEFERAQSQTSARILDTDTAVIRRERDAAQCDPAFLPFLAAERSVHHYDGSLATKRDRTAASFSDHLAYGTPAALEQEIALDTGLSVRVVEFFEERQFEFPDFAVDVVVEPGHLPPADLEPVRRSALLRKNVRETLAAVRVRYPHPPSDLYHGAAVHISPRLSNAFAVAPNLYHGAATRILPQQRIV
jgi:phage tail P2-like protein